MEKMMRHSKISKIAALAALALAAGTAQAGSLCSLQGSQYMGMGCGGNVTQDSTSGATLGPTSSPLNAPWVPPTTPTSTMNTGLSGSYSQQGVWPANGWGNARSGICYTEAPNFQGNNGYLANSAEATTVYWSGGGFVDASGYYGCNGGVVWTS